MTEHFPAPPPAAVSRVLASFDRHAIEGFIAVAIDLLDLADGDPDLEDDDPAGDPLDRGETIWPERLNQSWLAGGYVPGDTDDDEPNDVPSEFAGDGQ